MRTRKLVFLLLPTLIWILWALFGFIANSMDPNSFRSVELRLAAALLTTPFFLGLILPHWITFFAKIERPRPRTAVYLASSIAGSACIPLILGSEWSRAIDPQEAYEPESLWMIPYRTGIFIALNYVYYAIEKLVCSLGQRQK